MINIENKMKQIVDGHSIAPPNFVWNNIESNLDNKPKTNNNVIWYIGAIAILLLFSYLYWNANNHIQTSSNSNVLIIPKKSNNPKLGPNKSILPVVTEDPISIEKDVSNNEIIVETLDSEVSNTKISINSPKKSTITQYSENNSTKNKNLNSLNSNVLVETFIDEKTNKLVESNTKSEKLLEQNQLINYSLLPSKYNTLLPFQFDIPKIKDQVICPSFGKKGNGISTFLELGVIMGGHSINLENNLNDTETNQLLDKRKSTESNWYTWGAYVNLGINITPNFYVGTGIEYTQSKDQFDYTSGTITKMIINLDENGNPIDTSFVSGFNESKGEIKYSLIDIPLYIGAATNLGYFSIGAEIGAVLNISQSVTGKMVTLTDEINYIQDQDITYKNSVGIGLKAALILRKELSNGLSIQVKPGYKTYLNPISKDDYAIKSSYSTFNVNIGIRRDF